MIKAICYALCTVAIIGVSSGPLLAETHSLLKPHATSNFSPLVRLAANCKPSGSICKRNDQCCSGNCQKGTDMPKGTCLHGD